MTCYCIQSKKKTQPHISSKGAHRWRACICGIARDPQLWEQVSLYEFHFIDALKDLLSSNNAVMTRTVFFDYPTVSWIYVCAGEEVSTSESKVSEKRREKSAVGLTSWVSKDPQLLSDHLNLSTLCSEQGDWLYSHLHPCFFRFALSSFWSEDGLLKAQWS